jgi:mannosyl-oligosaccharide alpha-1,2-mannosidase
MRLNAPLTKLSDRRKGVRRIRRKRHSFEEIFMLKILTAFSLGLFVICLFVFIKYTLSSIPGLPLQRKDVIYLKSGTVIFPDIQGDTLARQRRTVVKGAMVHAWNAYRTHAFGYDEIRPVSGKGERNWFGVGTTLVDSLDTLWLMDLKEEFYEARDWVRDSLSHEVDELVSTFETTIRSMGGLLSAYYWSKDEVFKEKAEDIGRRLIRAFDSPSGIPYCQVNLKTGEAVNEKWSPRETQVAAAGTLQLEFRELSRVTNNSFYSDKPDRALDVLYSMKPKNGLYYTAIKNTNKTPSFGIVSSRLTFGGRADSFYEYMLKLWLQGGKTQPKYRDAYDKAIEGMHTVLLKYSSPSNLAYLAKIKHNNGGRLIHEFEHLECFMGGKVNWCIFSFVSLPHHDFTFLIKYQILYQKVYWPLGLTQTHWA